MITTKRLDAAVYRKAERLLRHNRPSLVLGGTVRPRWIEGGGRFWYTLRTATGRQFVLVDPRAGRREPAFDHERLAAALAAASGQEVVPVALPFSAIDLTTEAVEFDAFGAHWRCRLDAYECEKAEAKPAPVVGEVWSPDGKLAVFRRGYDLWARSLADGREWALTTDGEQDYDYLAQPRDLRILRLHRLDPVTGEVTTVLTETGDTRVEANQFWGSPPIVRALSSGEELLWYSQRDGWGHLYRYGAHSGELRGQVTSGEWAVREILHVDEEHRVVYFLASGLVTADPYRRSVCRVGLDGTGFVLVTADELDHAVTVAANGEYLLDSASTTDIPPVTTVRGWDGRGIVELERADITRLIAAGWSPPERFRVTAADGHTDIYGLLHLPADSIRRKAIRSSTTRTRDRRPTGSAPSSTTVTGFSRAPLKRWRRSVSWS